MTADELGRRVQHDVGAPFDRAAEERRRERVVHDQRKFVVVRNRRDRLDVEDVARRVADRFAVESLRVLADGGLPRIRIVGINPRQAHVHLAQEVLELVDGSAVER